LNGVIHDEADDADDVESDDYSVDWYNLYEINLKLYTLPRYAT
jgi:hypothetical protein